MIDLGTYQNAASPPLSPEQFAPFLNVNPTQQTGDVPTIGSPGGRGFSQLGFVPPFGGVQLAGRIISMKHRKFYFAGGLCLLLAAGIVRAQIPNASQQVDSVHLRRQLETSASLLARSNAAPEFYEGETGDVGPQSVVQYKRNRTFFEASADEQYFFTDNMFLANQGKQHADVLISTVQAALAPTPYEFAGGHLSPRIGFHGAALPEV